MSINQKLVSVISVGVLAVAACVSANAADIYQGSLMQHMKNAATNLWYKTPGHQNFYTYMAANNLLANNKRNVLLQEILNMQIMQCAANPKCKALMKAHNKAHKKA